MIWDTSEPNFLRWAFRLIEWILLITGAIVEFLSGYFLASPSTPLQFIALYFALLISCTWKFECQFRD